MTGRKRLSGGFLLAALLGVYSFLLIYLGLLRPAKRMDYAILGSQALEGRLAPCVHGPHSGHI